MQYEWVSFIPSSSAEHIRQTRTIQPEQYHRCAVCLSGWKTGTGINCPGGFPFQRQTTGMPDKRLGRADEGTVSQCGNIPENDDSSGTASAAKLPMWKASRRDSRSSISRNIPGRFSNALDRCQGRSRICGNGSIRSGCRFPIMN